MKCVFTSFAHFLVELLFTIEFSEFLYILETHPLSDVWFANISSWSIVWLFILSTFDEEQFNNFSFHYFGVKFKKLLLSPNTPIFLLWYLLKILQFLHLSPWPIFNWLCNVWDIGLHFSADGGPIVQALFIKKVISSSFELPLYFYQKINWAYLSVFPSSLLCSIVLCVSVPLPTPQFWLLELYRRL